MRLDQEQGAPTSIARRVFSLPTLISLALAVAFLAFLATRLDADLSETWQHLRAANPFYLFLAVVIHYTTFLFRGLRWRLLLNNVRGQEEAVAGILQCSRMVLLGWFANSVAWLRLGDAYRAYLYHEETGAPFVRTVGTILPERLLDVVIMVLLLALSLPFLLGSGYGPAWTVAVTAGILLGLLILVMLLLAAIGGGERGGARVQRFLAWLPGRLAERLLLRYRQFREGALQSSRRVPLAALWGLLGWLAEIARLYLVTRALGVELSPPLIVLVTLSNSLLTLVPTPGGVGAVEAGLTGLLKQLSTLATPAVLALVVVDRSISYLSVIATGAGLFLVRWALRQRRGTRIASADSEAEYEEKE